MWGNAWRECFIYYYTMECIHARVNRFTIAKYKFVTPKSVNTDVSLTYWVSKVRWPRWKGAAKNLTKISIESLFCLWAVSLCWRQTVCLIPFGLFFLSHFSVMLKVKHTIRSSSGIRDATQEHVVEGVKFCKTTVWGQVLRATATASCGSCLVCKRWSTVWIAALIGWTWIGIL